MSGPFIFLATNRLKPGASDRECRRVPGLVDFIEAGEPRLLAFNEYINAERTEVTVVQVHPDAASMEFHMGVVPRAGRERIRRDARLDDPDSGFRDAERRSGGDPACAGRRRSAAQRPRRAPRRIYADRELTHRKRVGWE